jgi:hypothetical protein
MMFIIELFVPFLLFFPRRIRHFAAGVLIAFQGLILLTGNYTFFNWLAIALCLLVFDDTAWPEKWKTKLSSFGAAWKWRPWPRAVTGFVAALILFLTFRTVSALQPLLLVNNYGLFAVMTTERDEIVVEGSNDGKNWLPYEFRYKPGDVKRRPAFVEPFQPRLDWQMWFAALSDYRHNPWFLRLCRGLLTGSPEVVKLLKQDPFPGKPPLYVRAVLYEYHFTDAAEKHATGAWWKREAKGLYCPVLSLKN